MNTLEILEKAIKEKKIITFNSKGEGTRIGNPHVIFSHITTNNITLELYQTSGYSSKPEELPKWRNFILSDLSEIAILEDTFKIAEGYNSNSKKYEKAICKIK